MFGHRMMVLGAAAWCALSGTTWAQYAQPNQVGPALLPLPQVQPQWNAAPASHAVPTAYRPAYPAYAQLQPPAPPSAAEAVQTPAAEPAPHAAPGPMITPTPANPNGYEPAYGAAGVNPYDSASCGEGCGDDCCLPTCCGPTWFGGVYGLMMSRDDSNHLCFSYDTNQIDEQPLTSNSIDWEYQGGVEARFGRTFGCDCCWGLEAVYWGVFNDSQSATATSAMVTGQLASSLSLNNLNIGGDNVTDYTTGADSYTLTRSYEVTNLELNFLRFGMLGGCGGGQCCGPYGAGAFGAGGSRLCLSGAAGVRFLRFDDSFNFYSYNPNWAGPEGLNYDVDVNNNLIGFQLGGRADYYATTRFSLFADTKFGIFGNYMEQDQYVINSDGTYATINNGPNSGREWNISSHKDDVSMLGEIRVGGAYQITQHWRAVAAYRAIGITGVALSTNQVPDNFGDYVGATHIDSNGSVILHGAQFGLEFLY